MVQSLSFQRVDFLEDLEITLEVAGFPDLYLEQVSDLQDRGWFLCLSEVPPGSWAVVSTEREAYNLSNDLNSLREGVYRFTKDFEGQHIIVRVS